MQLQMPTPDDVIALVHLHPRVWVHQEWKHPLATHLDRLGAPRGSVLGGRVHDDVEIEDLDGLADLDEGGGGEVGRRGEKGKYGSRRRGEGK